MVEAVFDPATYESFVVLFAGVRSLLPAASRDSQDGYREGCDEPPHQSRDLRGRIVSV